MKLTDEIIDEAEQLALLDPSCDPQAVIQEVSNIVGVDLHPNSTGAKLAVAAYNRYAATNIFRDFR